MRDCGNLVFRIAVANLHEELSVVNI